ncbi:MAG TPA: FAD-binding oxidoreductase [Candidatus Bathyarchaeia archaeon]|nr:FAD-binding oxidoreductase [Candidatus Bathyarchaeia archaeon]
MSTLRTSLVEIVGSENITNSIEPPDSCSDVYLFGGELHKPSLVVWPSTGVEVISIVKLANREGIPLVPWGGGSDLYAGGIVAPEGSIIICMQRMNRIRNIDTDFQTARVEAGISIHELNKQLAKRKLWWPHDPTSRAHATVGGSLSTNALGTHFAKFGSAGDMVRALKVVLPNGEIAEVGGNVKHSLVGYNLVPIFTGAEGTLGLIVEANLKLEPLPESRVYAIAKFSNIGMATSACNRILTSQLRPETLLLEDSMRFYSTIAPETEEQANRVRSLVSASEILVIVSFSGSRQEIETCLDQSKMILKQGQGVLIDQDVADAWWYGKTTRVGLMSESQRKQLGTQRYGEVDFCLQIAALQTVYEQLIDLYAKHTLLPQGVRVYFRQNGDVPATVVVLFDQSSEEQKSKYRMWISEVSQLALSYGGTMSGCTGTGLKQAALVEHELKDGISLNRAIKRALDPNNIMNPGKKFPL